MKTILLLTLTATITISGLLACTSGTTDTIPPVSASDLVKNKKTMKAFGSEQELARYLHELAAKRRLLERRELKGLATSDAAAAVASPMETLKKAENEDSVT